LLLVAVQGACGPTPAATPGATAKLSTATGPQAPVSGFAREFVSSHPIPDATVVVLETGQEFHTDQAGKYSFTYPVGARLTLQLLKAGFEPTQTDTVTVPAGGLTGAHDNITFQALFVPEYELLQSIIGMHPEPGTCHVATTIAARGKTMDDDPQGEPAARMVLSPATTARVFYFSVFKDRGPLADKTNPFVRTLDASSLDGGAVVFNLPPRDEPYTLSAEKAGLRFSQAKIWCRPDSFINVSPPRGPTVSGDP
jgi:hypothetical protein